MNGFTTFLKTTHYDKQDVKRIKVFFLLMMIHLVMNIIILQVDLDILCHLVEFQVNLSTRIVPGALPRVIVVQEAESLHATWVIFDRFNLLSFTATQWHLHQCFFFLQCFLLTSAFCKWSMIKFLL